MTRQLLRSTALYLTALCLITLAVAAAGAQAPDTLDVGQARIWSLTSGDDYDHSPFWSPSGDTIAFVRGATDGRIWIKASDGSGQARQITFGDGRFDDWYPDFAPDGRRVCFSSNRGGSDRVWTVSLDGGEPEPLAELGAPMGGIPPTWSPDGTRIAYSNVVDGNEDIYTMAVGGGAPRRVTGDPGNDQFPSWSPDGATLVYTSSRDRDAIWLIPSAGGMARSIPTGQPNVTNPKFSPDGRWILYRAGSGSAWHTWIIAADGGTPVAVTAADSLQGWMADWSPDGTRIAYTRGSQGGWGQLVITPTQDGPSRTLADSVSSGYAATAWSPDGSRIVYRSLGHDLLAIDENSGRIDTLARAVTHKWIGTPAWSPDGQWIAFCSLRLNNYNIWIAPVDGGEAEAVTLGTDIQAVPVWAPDGETIFYAAGGPGRWKLWSTTVWGDPPTLLLGGDTWDSWPVSVRPASGDLVFASDRPATPADTMRGYWSLPLAGGTPQRLFAYLFANSSGAPSADASRAVEADHDTGSIWVRVPVDAEPRLLVTDNARNPRFSPDGKHIAYVRLMTDEVFDIYLADVRRVVDSSDIP